MSTDLRPIDAPDLQPLRNSFEYDQLEAELKDAFIAVFNTYIRPAERQVNLSGMPHLGGTDLIERTLKDYGLAIVRRDATRTAFLLKAARARNPRRGMIFLKQYLQSIWPNVWKVEPLWHPVDKADEYPQHVTPRTSVALTSEVQAVYDINSNDGLPTIYRTDWQGKQLLYTTPRTNLHRYSAQVGGTGWSVTYNITPQLGARLGPDGVLSMTLLQTTVADYAYAYLTPENRPVVAPNQRYRASVYFAQGTSTRFSVVVYDAGIGAQLVGANVEFVNGVPTLSSAYPETTAKAVITPSRNGTYKLAMSFNSGAFTGAALLCYPDTTNSGNGGTYFDKPQIEIGDVDTSYIETGANAVTVTDYTVDANGVATFADGETPSSNLLYFLTGRIRVTLPVSVDNGLGLLEIAKAFRSTLAARLMLELQLSTVFENLGAESHGLSIAGGAKGVMPFMAIGTLTK